MTLGPRQRKLLTELKKYTIIDSAYLCNRNNEYNLAGAICEVARQMGCNVSWEFHNEAWSCKTRQSEMRCISPVVVDEFFAIKDTDVASIEELKFVRAI